MKNKKVSLYSRIRNLLNKKDEMNITFVYADKSRVVKSLTSNFLRVNNKPRKVDDIVQDIWALHHDRGSEYFYI